MLPAALFLRVSFAIADTSFQVFSAVLRRNKSCLSCMGRSFGGYEFCPYDVLHHHFKGLSMLLIHGKEETGQHDGNHSHRRKACACAVFEQKEKRQAEQESRRKTYNLPFGKVESYFCLDFG